MVDPAYGAVGLGAILTSLGLFRKRNRNRNKKTK
ncbi:MULTISPECIES: hypothetical protein [Enterococcus]